jgi:TM2 domain-containing membrane protein YozV
VLFLIFMFYGVDQLLPNEHIHMNWVYFGYFFCFLNLICFWIASVEGPGFVTKKNYQGLLQKYHQDNILYEKTDCTKCKFQK